ncbi:conserved hypothetical protein [Stigmatella aurantiaca DW4/3-1]|uniref:Uncharacterized protein n=1 Tax=Stigmatella aurantiaca (strain DW4/3-1) TaxID=378806 RepID=Q08Z83_STIAD|nr:conserved hypothetical protein [Stigmatella aurantiaca DW4/3-1]
MHPSSFPHPRYRDVAHRNSDPWSVNFSAGAPLQLQQGHLQHHHRAVAAGGMEVRRVQLPQQGAQLGIGELVRGRLGGVAGHHPERLGQAHRVGRSPRRGQRVGEGLQQGTRVGALQPRGNRLEREARSPKRLHIDAQQRERLAPSHQGPGRRHRQLHRGAKERGGRRLALLQQAVKVHQPHTLQGRVRIQHHQRAAGALADLEAPPQHPHGPQRREVARGRGLVELGQRLPEGGGPAHGHRGRGHQGQGGRRIRRRGQRQRRTPGGLLGPGEEALHGLGVVGGLAPGVSPLRRRGAEPGGCPERADDGGQHRVVHAARVGEAHLHLLRVHVHIHRVGLHVDEEHHQRLAPGRQVFLVTPLDGADEAPVPHIAVVDEGVDASRRGQGVLGRGDVAGDAQPQPPLLHREEVGVHVRAQRRGDALGGILRAGGAGEQRQPPVLHQEGHLRVRQGDPDDGLLHVLELRLPPAHELQPRGRVVEEVLHRHHRAHTWGRLLDVEPCPPLHRHPGAHLRLGLGGVQREARHGGDGRQRLAPETLADEVLQVVQLAQLAGGVTLQAQHRVLAPHAMSVIGHDDALQASPLQRHLDRVGPRIERVLHQLLHHRGGAFHHLTGGDLVDEVVSKSGDAGHGAMEPLRVGHGSQHPVRWPPFFAGKADNTPWDGLTHSPRNGCDPGRKEGAARRRHRRQWGLWQAAAAKAGS